MFVSIQIRYGAYKTVVLHPFIKKKNIIANFINQFIISITKIVNHLTLRSYRLTLNPFRTPPLHLIIHHHRPPCFSLTDMILFYMCILFMVI